MTAMGREGRSGSSRRPARRAAGQQARGARAGAAAALLLPLLLAAPLVPAPVAADVLPGDKAALLAFKAGLTSEGGELLVTWRRDTDPCLDAWTGVRCSCDDFFATPDEEGRAKVGGRAHVGEHRNDAGRSAQAAGTAAYARHAGREGSRLCLAPFLAAGSPLGPQSAELAAAALQAATATMPASAAFAVGPAVRPVHVRALPPLPVRFCRSAACRRPCRPTAGCSSSTLAIRASPPGML